MMEKSYGGKVREEIFNQKPVKLKNYKSFCYGILLMGKRFDIDCITISTEHLSVSKLYGFAVKDCCGVRPAFTLEKKAIGTELYTVALTDKVAIEKLMEYFNHTDSPNRELLEDSNFAAFLMGTFLACGSISDPNKSYHLEIIPPNEELCDLLFELLSLSGYPAKSTGRRGQTVLYFKESSQIEDILTMMGAVRCSLELMETKIYKDLRNRANRSTNCETANIDKLVRASYNQMEDITLLRESGEMLNLPLELVHTAQVREENPDSSLAELASLLGISRSGANYRLKKLSLAAQEYRDR